MCGHYLGYLENRPEEVTGALRSIATAPGAAIVHCAAGKDRTGVVVALALTVAGVEPEVIVADYMATDERLEAIVERLARSRMYTGDVNSRPVRAHAPRAETMKAFLEQLDAPVRRPGRLAGRQRVRRGRGRPAARQAQAGVTTVVRACLIDVYDTILTSLFVPRMKELIEPLGIGARRLARRVGHDARGPGPRQADRRRSRSRRTLRALGVEPEPDLLADLSRRDAEFSRSYVRLCDDTVPFLAWLRSRGTRIALVSNCADTTRALLDYLGIIPLVDAVVLSCEVGSMKPYPEIYVTALEDLGVAAVDAVFIDDQPTFCVGAQAVGVRPIQIARGEPRRLRLPVGLPRRPLAARGTAAAVGLHPGRQDQRQVRAPGGCGRLGCMSTGDDGVSGWTTAPSPRRRTWW